MVSEKIMKSLAIKTDSKIVLLVADGIGDIPSKDNKTVLEAASIPNFDGLASKSVCGLTDPIFLCLDMTHYIIKLGEVCWKH